MQQLLKQLSQHYRVSQLTQQRLDLAFVSAEPDQLRSLLTYLRDQCGFTHLVLLTAVDWLEQGQFQLTYLLNNRAEAKDLGIRVLLDRNQPLMESIHTLWPTAATYQRELKEMFGIDFPGSPRLDEEFILEGWNDIPPYRRDFDTLKYAAEQYAERPGRESHDPAHYMQQQLYPEQK
ncbi:NADH-quinone oxidoreductase subunit C [Ectothiorhodospiraceae bacterium BW-2]|nr:NADH-quinone oxidoreductase subunit C [Ectothiorhodospiraceae bacterium BW-2]